eukprot:GHVT01015899.1.p1 GENE.GHVT01015899.1~~GHVT01015899.1.p1  ORF type:complete len:208 (+),score=4.80 GHVT01015899.1:411-1034(+)
MLLQQYKIIHLLFQVLIDVNKTNNVINNIPGNHINPNKIRQNIGKDNEEDYNIIEDDRQKTESIINPITIKTTPTGFLLNLSMLVTTLAPEPQSNVTALPMIPTSTLNQTLPNSTSVSYTVSTDNIQNNNVTITTTTVVDPALSEKINSTTTTTTQASTTTTVSSTLPTSTQKALPIFNLVTFRWIPLLWKQVFTIDLSKVGVYMGP